MHKKISFYFLFFSCLPLQAKHFQITSIYDLLPEHPEIEYIKCHDVTPFEYKPFPIAQFPELQPSNGLFASTFILKIPNGQACSYHGWINIDNSIVSELIPPYFSLTAQKQIIDKTPFDNIQKISGKVAVITALFDTYYGHWLYNILGRLALLELNNIEYDWLFVPYLDQPFMKETLTLWGIDPAKIITPFGQTKYIQADELIVPSQIGVRTPQPHEYLVNWIPLELYCQKWNINPKALYLPKNTIGNADVLPNHININDCFIRWAPLCGSYFCPWTIDYLRSKFLPLIQNNEYNFHDKVFISRADSSVRQMVNEHEICTIFESLGFKKYILSNMSILEQITLFNKAKIIVAAHGTGLANSMFAQSGTTIIEIYQNRSDCCFYYLSQILGLHHYCIKTMEFSDINGYDNTLVNPAIIQKFITDNQALFDEKEICA